MISREIFINIILHEFYIIDVEIEATKTNDYKK